jgi:hypothetical protein
MQESYSEGGANHAGPESCVASREGRREALTGGSAGWVLSRETFLSIRGADVVEGHGRQHQAARGFGKSCLDLARSQTPCTRGHFLHGNREISLLAEAVAAVRIANPNGAPR